MAAKPREQAKDFMSISTAAKADDPLQRAASDVTVLRKPRHVATTSSLLGTSRPGLDGKFLVKWHCSVFCCYLVNIVQS
jgi:hypothetical protein